LPIYIKHEWNRIDKATRNRLRQFNQPLKQVSGLG